MASQQSHSHRHHHQDGKKHHSTISERVQFPFLPVLPLQLQPSLPSLVVPGIVPLPVVTAPSQVVTIYPYGYQQPITSSLSTTQIPTMADMINMPNGFTVIGPPVVKLYSIDPIQQVFFGPPKSYYNYDNIGSS